MATAPRRETLIALQARRTAHQVASGLYLHQHCKPLLRTCSHCGKEFVPDAAERKRCPNCQASFCSVVGAPPGANVPCAESGTRPSLLTRLVDLLGLILVLAAIVLFIAYVITPVVLKR